MIFSQRIGMVLKKLREDKGLSQEALAKKANVTQPSLGKLLE